MEEINGVETLLNPIVIIEILLDSTEAYDRGKKFSRYLLISSLQEYILISQNHCQVEKFLRGDDSWRYFSYEDMKQNITIDSVDAELLLSDIYYRVEFEVAGDYVLLTFIGPEESCRNPGRVDKSVALPTIECQKPVGFCKKRNPVPSMSVLNIGYRSLADIWQTKNVRIRIIRSTIVNYKF